MKQTLSQIIILKALKRESKKINPYAKIKRTAHCAIPLEDIVGLNAFSSECVLKVEPDFLDSYHDHDDEITSASFVSETPLDFEKLQKWLETILKNRGQDILRSKGILVFDGLDDRYVFQSVLMLMDGAPMGLWPAEKPRHSRVVFIGRGVENMGLEEGFNSCKAA